MKDKIERPLVSFKLDAEGGLLIDAPNFQLTVGRSGVDNDSRNALAAFVQSLERVSSLDELALNEKVVMGENCMSILRDDALPTFFRKGQLVDDTRTIEILLREGRSLLRSSPLASQISVTEALRDEILAQKYQGQAASVILLKRAANAAAANA